MIGRIWHGWTSKENADAYERLLCTTVLPGIRKRAGSLGTHLMRTNEGDEVKFVTICWFDTMDSVRAFAGPDGTSAVVPPAARALLARFDAHSEHYDLVEHQGRT